MAVRSPSSPPGPTATSASRDKSCGGRAAVRAFFVGLAFVALVTGATSCSTSQRQVRTSGSSLDEDGRLRENTDEDGQMRVGADARVDLAIFFKPAVSDRQIVSFIDGTLNTSLGGARFGKDLLPGMQSTLADYERRAVYVGYFDNATPKEREAVEQAALASELVDRIEARIVPSEKSPRA